MSESELVRPPHVADATGNVEEQRVDGGEPATATDGGQGTAGSVAEQRSQASRLVDLAEAAGVVPFRTPDDEACIVVPHDGHEETWRVRSHRFRAWLRRLHYRERKASVHESVVAEAVATIESKALYDGDVQPVFIRVGGRDGKLYLDLADEHWRIIEIDSRGWRLANQPSVRFLRPNGMRALPVPVAGGTLDELREVINVPDDSFKLVVAWLLSAFQLNSPFPILAIHGEQGSGKTTQAMMLRGLIDPNKAALRSFPREEQDLVIAAMNGWIVAFDNVSFLPHWLSDALCRLSTGTAFGRRQLYTDADEVLFEAKRPILLNGIEEVTVRGDLADRTVPIVLPSIPEHLRRTEAEVLTRYEAMRPRVVGSLLDVVVGILTRLPTTQLACPPRMADFARWVTAGEPALGWPSRTFMALYTGNRKGTSTTVVESSPVASAIRDLVAISKTGVVAGTATEILMSLNGAVAEAVQRSRDWPAHARALSGAVRRIAPALRAVGIAVDWSQTGGAGSKRIVTFRAAPKASTDATGATDAV